MLSLSVDFPHKIFQSDVLNDAELSHSCAILVLSLDELQLLALGGTE